MAITPLYTKAELDTLIAELKVVERKLMTDVSEYSRDMGGTHVSAKRRELDDVRSHMQYLHKQRMQVEGVSGPQSIAGRVYRG